MRLLLLALLLLTACGRPLTPNETAFLTAIQGDQLDPARVRFHNGLAAGSITFRRPIRPRLTCMERIWPPSRGETITVAPGAMTLFNRVFYRKDLYRDDFMASYPTRVDLLDAMLMAHEMVHVWQWQNRRRTGYSPLKAATEHGRSADPYLFDPDSKAQFLDHGYEQQGAIVEEYVCCHILDPEAPRTGRLRDMIGAEMPVERLDAALKAPEVLVPWAGIQKQGICR
ncbi:hypothetical protein M4578_06010 [Salipiger sp. P9]|uniref:hypothetical protein n=1 Tax=Salipiger pentaromativorans TaxID=2943193 RepID=UPI0021573E6E|nr:hypothetical protein [Salipiger pentaromativorans]MCR8547373.1 hypothetical protein [Salipiger pentaromativorans]